MERVTKEEIKQLSGEKRETPSVSQEYIADVLHHLHTTTSLQADKSKIPEQFTNDRKQMRKEEETAAVSINKTKCEKDVERKSSSNQHENKNCLKEEKEDEAKYSNKEASMNKIDKCEILSVISINKQCEAENIFPKPSPSAEMEYSVKLPDDYPPVHETDKEEIMSNKAVKESINKDFNSAENTVCSTTVESENQLKIKNMVIPIAETNKPMAPDNLNQSALRKNIKTEHKKRQRQVESSSPHHKLLPYVSHVEKCLEEWFTMDTICFLFGETALKDMLKQKGESIQAHYNALGTVTWDQEKHERFLAICKRLSLLDIEDNNFDNQVS